MKKTNKPIKPIFKLAVLCIAMSQCLAPLAEAATYAQRVVVKDLIVDSSAGPQTSTPQTSIASTSTTDLSFGDVYLGLSSVKSVLLTNSGTAALNLTATPAVSGDPAYSAQTDCTGSLSSLAEGQFCTTNVTFSPGGAGAAMGSLRFLSDAQTGNDITVALTGTGLSWKPLLSISPPTFNFGQVANGSTATAVVTLSNQGTFPVTLSVGNPTGGFVKTGSTCNATLAASGSCTVSASFTPGGANTDVTGFSLPVTWGLGNEVVSIPAASTSFAGTTSVSDLAFDGVPVGGTSSKTFTFSNTGTASLSMGAPTVTAPYSVVGDAACSQPILAGHSCVVTVTYAPLAIESTPGTVTLPTNGGDFSVGLTGHGTSALGLLQITPASIAFGDVASGTSAKATVTLKNTGTTSQPLAIGTPAAPFRVDSTTCGTTLAANASCGVTVEFLADAHAYTAGYSLPVQWDALHESANVGLTGKGVDPSFAGTEALLHNSGAAGSTAFVDSSAAARTVQVFGTVKQSSTQTMPGFGNSAYFDGNQSYLRLPNSSATTFATGDFTVEAWVYPIATGAYKVIMGTASSGTVGWELFLDGSGKHLAWYANGFVLTAGSATISPNQWYHVAVSRQGNTQRFYVNGTIDATVTSSINYTDVNAFQVGQAPEGIAGRSWNGYIDEVRVTKGTARYTGNSFTVPTSEFPNQ
jgi:hypothetical protein